MQSVPFGFEATLNNNGANMGMVFKRPVTIVGVQVDCSIMSNLPNVGWSEVLFDCVVYPSGNIQGAPPHVYLGEIANPDVAFDPIYSFNDATGGTAHGGAGNQGRLFGAIAKMWAPSAASRVINLTGLNIAVPVDGNVLFHMDGAGIMCNAEMQGVIFYQ